MHALRLNRRDSPILDGASLSTHGSTRLDSMAFPIAAAICRRDRERSAFPSESSSDEPAIDGNAIRDWTPHMISRPVHRAVLFVCRNREDLAWISAFKLDCSYLQSLSLSLSRSRSVAPSPPLEKPRTYPLRLRFGLLPRRFSFRLVCAYVRAFFHVFFSPVFLCTVHGMSGHVDLLRKAILVISRHC